MSTDSIEQYVFWILKVSCSFKMFDAIRSEWQNSKNTKQVQVSIPFIPGFYFIHEAAMKQ